MSGLTAAQEDRAQRIAARRRVIDRARTLAPLLVRDPLQKSDDLIQALNDRRSVRGGICGIAGCGADLVDEIVELLVVHGSPPVGDVDPGRSAVVEPIVGAASGVTSPGTPDAPSGGAA